MEFEIAYLLESSLLNSFLILRIERLQKDSKVPG